MSDLQRSTAFLAWMMGLLSGGAYAAVSGTMELAESQITITSVNPADTCVGILPAESNDGSDRHVIAVPTDPANRKPVLVVFLGGSTQAGAPGRYQEMTRYAARLGYTVINLSYPNNDIIGRPGVCGNDDECYFRARGEVLFGEDATFTGPSPFGSAGESFPVSANTAVSAYSGLLQRRRVDKTQSAVNRLVCLIDYMAKNYPNNSDYPPPEDGLPYPPETGIPRRAHWQQFLEVFPGSPYESQGLTGVDDNGVQFVAWPVRQLLPYWPRIVLAGHSQGGGHAVYLGMRVPANRQMRRVVTFSSPQDNFRPDANAFGAGGTPQSATWITRSSNTSLDRFWGLVADDEGSAGDFVLQNWTNLGLSGGGGLGGTQQGVLRDVFDGGAIPFEPPALPSIVNRRLRATVTAAAGSLRKHGSTAADDQINLLPQIRKTWRYLFTAAYTD